MSEHTTTEFIELRNNLLERIEALEKERDTIRADFAAYRHQVESTREAVGKADAVGALTTGLVEQLTASLEQAKADRDTLAAEVRAQRSVGGYSTDRIICAQDATDASGALSRAKGGE